MKKPLAFCAGIGVTALVQSSNATTKRQTACRSGSGSLAPALVIEAKDVRVGTALMARILTFDLSWLSPLLIFIGVIFSSDANSHAPGNWAASVLVLG